MSAKTPIQFLLSERHGVFFALKDRRDYFSYTINRILIRRIDECVSRGTLNRLLTRACIMCCYLTYGQMLCVVI